VNRASFAASGLLASFLGLILSPLAVRAGENPISVPRSQSAEKLTPAQVAERVAGRLKSQKTFPVHDTVDLELEGLLALDDGTGRQDNLHFVQQVMRDRGMPPNHVHPYSSQMIVNLAFELYERTKDLAYVQPFLDETRKYRAEVSRTFDGAIAFSVIREAKVVKMEEATIYFDPTTAILIDHAQEYASRMAKAGWLSGDQSYYEEALTQLRLFRAALHDPASGLWGHGRGWYGTAKTVHSTKWGRANAWLLRGLVETLKYLPAGSTYARETSAMLTELAAALVKYQDAEGLWHQVIDRPDSFAETSGSALICYDFARAVHGGWLPEQPYRYVASKAFKGLARHKISRDGTVYGTAVMNPPLPTAEDYMRWRTPVDDPYGVAAVLLCTAGQLLSQQ
jgi:unsaturated rhamnogalacturonyl hydrolase